MSESTPAGSKTMILHDLREADRHRADVEIRVQGLQARMKEAFGDISEGDSESEQAWVIQAFLQVVAAEVHRYRSRARIQNPETGALLDTDWLTLCGTTIGQLEVPPRIQRLVVEVVASLLPEDDQESCKALARAAGVTLDRRVSNQDVKALQKQGMMASFGGKLLVDSRHVVSSHSKDAAAEYFDMASRIAEELEQSPYQTRRDRRFLTRVQQRYGGGLPSLVAHQRGVAAREITARDSEAPRLEGALRRLLQVPASADLGQSIEDWYISARIAFQTEAFVHVRLDELRSDLRSALAAQEQTPLLNPEATREEASDALAKWVSKLAALLQDQDALVGREMEHRRDVLQILRDNAAVLAKPEVVEDFIALIEDEEMVTQLARYQVAGFRNREPDLRKRLHSNLVIWDEILRSAPLAEPQQARVEALREELLTDLEECGSPAPEGIREAKMLLPFAGEILSRIDSESAFDVFEEWLEQIKRVYNERPASDDYLPALDTTPVPPPPAGAETSPEETRSTTRPWAPTLMDLQRQEQQADPPAGSDPGEQSGGDPARQASQPTSSSSIMDWLRGLFSP